MSADSEPPPPPKYSRYRSVRQATASKSPPRSSPAKPPEVQNEAIQRSRSRYRRPRVASPPARDVTSMPTIPHHLPTLQSLQGTNEALPPNCAQELRTICPVAGSRENLQKRVYREPSGSDLRVRGRTEHREDRSQTVKGAQVRSLKGAGEPVKEANGLPTEEDEVARLLAEQKRKDLQRLEMELAAAAARPSTSPERSSPPTNKAVEKLSLFTRKRAESKAAPSKSSSSFTASEAVLGSKSQEPPKVKADEQPRNIIQGGGGVVPGTDAPKSAVNAGERVCSYPAIYSRSRLIRLSESPHTL
jgi:hypothetical protein